MYSFEVVNNSPLDLFFHKVLLAPSKCLFKWIKVDKRHYFKKCPLHPISKILFILELYKFLACLECISRNGLSFGHSEWHTSSVLWDTLWNFSDLYGDLDGQFDHGHDLEYAPFLGHRKKPKEGLEVKYPGLHPEGLCRLGRHDSYSVMRYYLKTKKSIIMHYSLHVHWIKIKHY